MSPTIRCEIAIVGAGMVGSALARALARAGFEVAVLEQSAPPPFNPDADYDLRVSAVSLASEYLLRNLDVWESIAAGRVSPYREMHVWDACGRASLHFDCADIQRSHLGHIIENNLIQSRLVASLKAAEGVHWLCPATVAGFDAGSRRATVRLDGGREVHARLVIAADGANSPLRRLAGIELDRRRYHQQGIVSVVRPERDHRATAWQRFLPTGPLALLPLGDGRCSIVWSADDAEAQRLLELDENTFCRKLTEASEARLGAIAGCGPRAAFPLHYQHARRYVDSRLALVGDAAHVVHPLAGQGVNLGLLDAVELAGVLNTAGARGADPGSRNVLRRYERARRGENSIMAMSFDALNRLFGVRAGPAVWLRNRGMEIVDRAPALKHFFMYRASGLTHAMMQSDATAPNDLLTPPEFRD